MGYHDVRVVPPVVNLRRLLDGRAARVDAAPPRRRLDGPILLSVGQLMPHKRPDFLVQMMHIADDLPRLARLPDARRAPTARALHARDPRAGARAEPARRARRRARSTRPTSRRCSGRADAVVTASEHEGFCIPLLEAMTFEKPIVARACAAIPETVGDAALLLPPHHGPAFFAEAVDRADGRRADLREQLVAGGRRRLAEIEQPAAGRRGRRSAARGRVMRILYVVQRYGETIAGGAEQHCREMAERMARTRSPRRGRDHVRAVVRRLGRRRTSPAGRRSAAWPCTGSGSAAPRDNNRFDELNRADGAAAAGPGRCSSSASGCASRVRGRPIWSPGSSATRTASTASSASRTSTGRRGPRFDALRGRGVPLVLHPTVHDEPPLRHSLFDSEFRAPDAFALATPEEIDLIRRRFHFDPPGDVCGIGVEVAADRADPAAVPRRVRPRRQAVPAVRRPDRRGQGRAGARRLLHRVQGSAPGRRPRAGRRRRRR